MQTYLLCTQTKCQEVFLFFFFICWKKNCQTSLHKRQPPAFICVSKDTKLKESSDENKHIFKCSARHKQREPTAKSKMKDERGCSPPFTHLLKVIKQKKKKLHKPCSHGWNHKQFFFFFFFFSWRNSESSPPSVKKTSVTKPLSSKESQLHFSGVIPNPFRQQPPSCELSTLLTY